ncbi:general transcription factor IIF subunit 1 [Lepeophtheirus salmonis]|uniref:general transcription factor IIF subunit 1 n=1 Tax=Lepeophtheirus salmonis TaxID=72036 RepID=UPI001AE61F43|nr:general transcription factor IIF subunit 1-like [Lepeophtheirus salmonis]
MANNGASSGSMEEEVSEFIVRVPPRNSRKSHHVMKFNASLNIDFTKWAQGTVRMVRENNQKASKAAEAEMPKYGAGSEFGREQKEEARRKKYGYNKKKYKPEDQPWLIRVGDKKTGRRYRGIREGGVAENTTYYVFTHAQDGAFEAHPISDWYNFTPILTYKTLNSEEAEEKFAERGKILNHWALMVNKKIRSAQDEEEEMDDDGSKSVKRSSKKDNAFKISDMDDWVEEGDELETDSEDEKKKKNDSDDEGKKKKGKDSRTKKKRSKEDVQNEAFEDSDDGDDECREVDYMSDESSDSENEMMEKTDAKGVDQDQGLARMLDSESSSDEDEIKKKSDKEEEVNEENEDEAGTSKKDKKKKKDKKGSGNKKDGKQSTNSSRSSSPTPNGSDKQAKVDKRKSIIDNILDPGLEPAQKKSRLETFGSSSSSIVSPLSGSEAALEEDVRRYLARKPMTTTELVKKIHSKRFQDSSSEELMPLLVNVLKKVKPITSKTKGIMYLSLKPDK